MIIRNLQKGETVPDELKTGFEVGDMPEWIWLVERDGEIVAMLITAPAHVVVILLRLMSTSKAHPLDIKFLLAKAGAEIKERGFKAYVTWLNPQRKAEESLLGIIRGSGGVQLDEPQVICAGRL